MSEPSKIFITYSHKDTKAREELRIRLAVMEQQGKITLWDDNKILPGDEWYKDISDNLADSDILLYLVSASSLASENCNKELGDALDSKIRVIPVILESCDWQNHRLSEYEVLPNKGKPINEWTPESKAWQNVVKGVQKVVDKIQAQTSYSAQKEALPKWVFRLGNFLIMIGQIDRAIEAYSHVIEFDSNSASAYSNRGVAYDIKGYADQAIADLNKAIELKLDDAVAYYNRGIVYRSKGDVDRAIEDYTKAIELSLDYAVAYYNRGEAYYIKRNLDRAIEDYSQAIELKKNYVEAYSNRGIVYRSKGDVDRAIEDYTKAIELSPDRSVAYYNRGFAYYVKGAYDRAIKEYSQVIELNPDYHAYFARGMCWLHLQDWQEAKSDLIIAKSMGMDIIAAFHGYYRNIETFGRRSGILLPEDIATMLTQRRRSRFRKEEKEKLSYVDAKPLDESSDVVNLRERLRSAGRPLAQYVKTRSYFGISTGRDEAFVVDSATRDELIAEHPSSADILKPFLHGRGIKRWQVEAQGLWLILAYRGIEINSYPAIQKHLEKYRDSLSKRAGKQKWYELQATLDDSKRFTQTKLVCPNLYNHQTFAIETDGFYCGHTCYIIPTEETWLCGVLNSRVVEWFYSQVSNQLTGDELRALSSYMQQIPIPNITSTQKGLIGKIVDYLIYLQRQPTTNSKDLAYARDYIMLRYFERIIDGLVYESYLSEELHQSGKHFFKPLLDEQLLKPEEIQGDKMSAFRDIFEHLYEKTHPIRKNLFFLDSLKPIRIIEGKV